MDDYIHNIKTSRCIGYAPNGHTVHKTQRAPRKPCERGGQAPGRDGKPPPARRSALCGLLNVYYRLMAADFTNYRKIGRLFAFLSKVIVNRSLSIYRYTGGLPVFLSEWQCFVAKYP